VFDYNIINCGTSVGKVNYFIAIVAVETLVIRRSKGKVMHRILNSRNQTVVQALCDRCLN